MSELKKMSVILFGGAGAGKTVFCKSLLDGFDEYKMQESNPDSQCDSTKGVNSYVIRLDSEEYDDEVEEEDEIYVERKVTFEKPSAFMEAFMRKNGLVEVEVIDVPGFNDNTVKKEIDFNRRNEIAGILMFPGLRTDGEEKYKYWSNVAAANFYEKPIFLIKSQSSAIEEISDFERIAARRMCEKDSSASDLIRCMAILCSNGADSQSAEKIASKMESDIFRYNCDEDEDIDAVRNRLIKENVVFRIMELPLIGNKPEGMTACRNYTRKRELFSECACKVIQNVFAKAQATNTVFERLGVACSGREDSFENADSELLKNIKSILVDNCKVDSELCSWIDEGSRIDFLDYFRSIVKSNESVLGVRGGISGDYSRTKTMWMLADPLRAFRMQAGELDNFGNLRDFLLERKELELEEDNVSVVANELVQYYIRVKCFDWAGIALLNRRVYVDLIDKIRSSTVDMELLAGMTKFWEISKTNAYKDCCRRIEEELIK